MKKFAILLLAVMLAGCGAREAIDAAKIEGGGDPLKTLQSFVLADLKAASAQAHEVGDKVGFACWDALIPAVENFKKNGGTDTVGAFSAFEKARGIRLGLTSRNSAVENLNVACAPLVLDTERTIARLGIIAGGGVITGGAALPVLSRLGNIGGF